MNAVNVKNYQICTNCVMDTTDIKITFDENGVCDHCNTYYKDIYPYWNKDKSTDSLITNLANKIKLEGKDKEFDCIIGMSGGVDSSYLTYYAKEVLGLRPLVFHVDAGWNSNEAVNNIERIVDKLNLDLYTEVINWEEMRDLQLAFFKASVPHIDTPQDHAFFATMYKFAHKYKVKYILTGGNYATECIRNPLDWMYYQSDTRQIKDIHRKFGSAPLKKFPLSNILWHKVYLRYFKNIKVIRPLDYIHYDGSTTLLEERFGYQKYSQKHFESRFTRFYEGYWLPQKFGYDTRKVQFASLILTGQMSREEAITKLKSTAYDPDTIKHDFEYVANKLEIEVSELQNYMDAPNKSYRDYKSQYKLYQVGSQLMKKLKFEKGGKR